MLRANASVLQFDPVQEDIVLNRRLLGKPAKCSGTGATAVAKRPAIGPRKRPGWKQSGRT